MTDAQIYFTSAFITGISALVLCVVVSLKAKYRLVAHHFAWYTLAIGFWALFVGLATSTKSESLSTLYSLICHASGLFIPLTFLNFVQVYTGNQSLLIRRFLTVGYTLMLALCVVIIVWPHLFISSVSPKLGFSYFPNPGPFYHFWVLFFAFVVSLAHALLFKEGLRQQGAQRKKILAFLIANLTGYLGATGAFFPVYNLDLFPFPYGIWGVFFFTLITAYAVLRLKMIDIQSEIKRTVVFAGLFFFIFATLAGVSTLMQEVLTFHLHVGRLFSVFISVFIIVLFYNRLRSSLIHLTDRFLFQKESDYQQILKDASRGMSQVQSLRRLIGLVVHFMTIRARIQSAAIYLRNKESDDFVLQVDRGYEDQKLPPVVLKESLLVDFFSDTREALDRDRIELMLQGRQTRTKWSRAFIQSVLDEMNSLEATVVVPTFLGGVLKYFLVLGEKKSRDTYTNQDLTLLYTLAQESAIAIENARLFDEAVKKNRELQQINEQLNEASLKLQNALLTTEQANKKLQDTQVLLIHEQKMATLGRLASSVGHEVNNPLTVLQMNLNRIVLKNRKNPALLVNEISDFFPRMESNINRIKAVVNTLTGLLKQHERGRVEPLSLKIILEETLPLVQFQTYLDNLSGTDIVFNIPGNLPLIRGDLERLQEVFLNLFINSFQAMADEQNRRIEVSCQEDPEDPRIILIRFTDNGCGMDEETLKKIFNFRFTTKIEGKGSGLGLYMTKYIIDWHL